MTYNIQVIEYGTNKPLMDIQLDMVPRIGEYLIADNNICADWEEKFYIVRAVTYLLSNKVVIHLEKQDMARIKETDAKMSDIMDRLRKKFGDNNEK